MSASPEDNQPNPIDNPQASPDASVEKRKRWHVWSRRVSLEALRPTHATAPDGPAETVAPPPAWLQLTFLTLAVVKIALVAVLPLCARPNATFDDAIFMRLACQISSGNWLGPYDQYTLAKGPMYPIFISLCHFMALPLELGEHLVYIAFCLVLIRALRPLGLRPWWLLVLYTLILFTPEWMVDGLHYVTRERLYTGLSGMVFACAIGMLLRRHLPLRWTCLWAVGLGLSLTCLLLTREEGVWVVPSLLLLLGWAGWTVLRHHPQSVRWFLACCLPLGLCFLGDSTLRLLNWNNYGTYIITEFKAPEFLAAYGALCRIKQVDPHRLVPVPKEVRLRAYKVSPAFRDLQPFLEGSLGQVFIQYCADQDLKCNEIGGGHFMWALRDAVAAAGHCKSGKEAMQYYAKVADEINAACDQGSLDAGPRRDSLLPPFDSRCLPFVGSSFVKVCQIFLFISRDGLTAEVPPSFPDEHAVAFFREMSHCSLSPCEPPMMRVKGTAFVPNSLLDLRVVSAKGGLLPSRLTWQESPGLYVSLRSQGHDIPNALHAQFTLAFPKTENCKLAVLADGKLLTAVPLDGEPHRSGSPALHLFVSGLQPDAVDLTEMKDVRKGILRFIGACYLSATVPLVCLALAAFLLQCSGWLFGRRNAALLIIELALLGGAAARVMMLAVLDAVALPKVASIHYLMPAYPLLLTLCVLSLAGAVPSGVAIFRRFERGPTSPAGGAPTELHHTSNESSSDPVALGLADPLHN